VTVLDLGGKITIGEGSVSLRSAIRRLIEEGKKKILLNLAQVSYVDSSGIGELVSSFTTINREGGQLKLLNLTQKIQDLLAITKLLTVFDVYEDEQTALNSFQ
jgi:anti-sigma B factor antagonist